MPGKTAAYEERELLSMYSKDIGRIERLPYDQLLELFDRLNQGDVGAKEKFVGNFLPLVISIATAERRRCQSAKLCDLIGWGNIGLLEALRRFRLDKKCKFSTYATIWIRRYIKDSIASLSFLTHSDHIPPDKYRYIKTQQRLMEENQTPPTISEVAKAMKIPFKQAAALQALIWGVRLECELTRENSNGLVISPYLEAVGSDAPPVSELAGNLEVAAIINEKLESLSAVERDVVRMRYGLGKYDGKQFSLEVIAKVYGLTRERIRQIEERARGILSRKLRKVPSLRIAGPKVLSRVRYAKLDSKG